MRRFRRRKIFLTFVADLTNNQICKLLPMLTLYANLKGGTGKSTVVFNMAMWRVAQGKKVTVCDLDQQRTVKMLR